MGSCLEGKIGINEGFYYEFFFFFLRNRVYSYLMEKRTVIIVKEVKMMVRELKYLKKLEGYPEHDLFHGEDTYIENLQLKVVPRVR